MDAPDPDKAGFIMQTWHWVVAALAAVVAWLARDSLGRIKTLEETSLTKEEYREQNKEIADDLSRSRHDLRNDLQKIVSAIELDRMNLRSDLKGIFDQQRVMGEDIAEIKGKMK